MITSLSDFDAFCSDPAKLGDSNLAALSKEELAFFRYCLDFGEDGSVKKIYFGDLARKGLDDAGIMEVAALFGIEEKRFKRTYHHFGDAQGTCVSRPYFWCPY